MKSASAALVSRVARMATVFMWGTDTGESAESLEEKQVIFE